MRIILALALTVAALACNAEPEIRGQLEVRAWFVNNTQEYVRVWKACPQEKQLEAGNEESKQVILAAYEAMQRLGEAAVREGVDVERNSIGEYEMGFEEDISGDAWRAIVPEVEAYIELADLAFAAWKRDLVDVGCTG